MTSVGGGLVAPAQAAGPKIHSSHIPFNNHQTVAVVHCAILFPPLGTPNPSTATPT